MDILASYGFENICGKCFVLDDFFKNKHYIVNMRKEAYFRGEVSPVAIVRIGGQTAASPHDHEFHELVLVLRGSGVHFTDGESYAIHSGDVFLIPPGYKHGYRETSDLDLVNILYSEDRIGIPDFDIRDVPGYHAFFKLEPEMRRTHKFKSRLTLGASALSEVEAIVLKMEGELDSDDPGGDFMVVSYFMRLQCLIARSYGKASNREGKTLIRLADVVAYVERNYKRRITLGELAEVARMSLSTLHRSFVEATGFSPVEFLVRTRVLKGAELLRGGGFNVSEAAFAVGFNDSNYFSRQFRKVMGVSPRKYAAGFKN